MSDISMTAPRLLLDWMAAHAVGGIVTATTAEMAAEISTRPDHTSRALQTLCEIGAVRRLQRREGAPKSRFRLLECELSADWGTVVRYEDARIEHARRLWDEGKTAGQIAGVLGMSKNAVIGLAHRNNFPPRKRAYRPRPVVTRPSPAPLEASPPPPEPPPTPPPPPVVSAPPIVLSPARGCQMPLWKTGAKPTHRYCDKPTPIGSSWCPACRARVFNRVSWRVA